MDSQQVSCNDSLSQLSIMEEILVDEGSRCRTCSLEQGKGANNSQAGRNVLEERNGEGSVQSWSIFAPCETNACESGEGEQHNAHRGSGDHSDCGLPDGFELVLRYMDLKSLLCLERVCKPMQQAVKDVLLWQEVCVEPPLNRKFTDDILLALVERADGCLKFLVLVKCLGITVAAVERVLSLNPGIEKLSLPGCTGVIVEELVTMVQEHSLDSRAKGFASMKQLRVKGMYKITREHLNVLQTVIQSSNSDQVTPTQPLYWSGHDGYVLPDGRAIDVDLCPLCKTGRMVYDCTLEELDETDCWRHVKDPCRECLLCILRCFICGRCLNVSIYGDDECGFPCCPELRVCWPCGVSFTRCNECHLPSCGRHCNGASFTCENCAGRKI